MPCDLSVVLPVYDEARVLAVTLAQLVPHLEGLGKSFEIVCVDDGSTDGSWEILQRLAAADERVRVDRLPENRGKGAAVRKGMLAAEGELVVFMDADLSTPLDEMVRFLGALDSGYDVVIGNRRAPGSEITRHQPWIRETLGRGFTVLTRVLLAPGVHDFTCGFKGFRRDAARKIFARSSLNGWAFDAELVVIAHSLGLKLAQVPVAWHDEEGTKVRILQAVLGSLRELIVIRWKRMKGDYK
jgi:dolichyl-phosphate beta-glucosyltransferase